MKKIFVIILSAFIVIFPWISYLQQVQLSEAELAIFGGTNGMTYDFFIQSKEIVLLTIVVLAVVWFAIEQYLTGKDCLLFQKKNMWLYILMGIFLVGMVVSTVLSEYPKNAVWGDHTIGEGIWTLIAYLILILLFYNYFAFENAFEVIKKALVILSGITGVLSFVEWFYKPLLEIKFIQRFVAPVEYTGLLNTVKADRYTDAIALTFYNPGYFGGFVCLLIPFILAFYLYAKQMKRKVLYGVLLAGLLFGVIASGSTTALYVAILEIVAIILLYILLSQNKKDTCIQSAVAILVTIVSLFTFGALTGNFVINLASNQNSIAGAFWFGIFEVKDIQLKDNSVQLVGIDKTLGIYYENGRFVFRDADGKQLETIRTDGGVTFAEEGYESLKITGIDVSGQVEGVLRCVQVYAGYLDPIEFFLLEDGTFSGIGQGGAIIKDIGDAGTPEALKKYYGILTGRGYIWSNTLPILKDCLLIGKGPGNFAFYFKHFDYVGMLKIYRTIRQVITKPHNAYLQYITAVGLPAALAFFGIFAGVMRKAAKILWKNRGLKEYTETDVFCMAATVMLLGFFIYSLINDSVIVVTPVVCMLTGILLASCHLKETKIYK